MVRRNALQAPAEETVTTRQRKRGAVAARPVAADREGVPEILSDERRRLVHELQVRGSNSVRAALTGLRVLVVEDQSDTREALAVTLETFGAEVATAASAEAGRAVLAHFRPDVLVSDIGMPEEDGYTFIRRLRSEESGAAAKRLPAVALTAHGSSGDRVRALDAGFDQHVAKPIELESLVLAISSVVRRTAAQSA